MQMKRRWKSLLHDEAGSELVEFAVSALVLFAVFFAILEFSLSMYAYHFVTTAAQAGARYAIVRGADWSTACSTSAPPKFTMSYSCSASASDVSNYVKSLPTAGIDPSRITVTTTWPGTTPDCSKNCTACAPANSQGCLVKVNVNYLYGFVFRLTPGASIAFSGTSEKTIQQ